MKTTELLISLSLTPLPQILPAPVPSDNRTVQWYFSRRRGWNSIPKIAELISLFPEAAISCFGLALIVRNRDRRLALRFFELAAAYEARALGADAIASWSVDQLRSFLNSLYWQAVYSLELNQIKTARFLLERLILLDPDDRCGARGLLAGIYLAYNDEPSLIALRNKFAGHTFLEASFAELAFAIDKDEVAAAKKAVGDIAFHNEYILLGIVGSVYLKGESATSVGAIIVIAHLTPAGVRLGRLADVLRDVMPKSRLVNPVGVCGGYFPPLGLPVAPHWKALTPVIDRQWRTPNQ